MKLNRLIVRTTIMGMLVAITTTLVQAAPWQEDSLPDTPAGKRFASLLECANKPQPAQRVAFLRDGFTDAAEFGERVTILKQLHKQFAPITYLKTIKSEPFRIVVQCATKEDVVLQLEMEVSKEGANQITSVGMEPVEDTNPDKLPEGLFPLFDAPGKTAAATRGIWEADGYGYVFEVKEGGFTVYNVTKNYAWVQEFGEELFYKLPGKNKGQPATDHIVLTSHPLEPGYNMVRLQSLPESCLKKIDWTPTNLFEAYVEIFEEHYPFFSKRNVDWQARAKGIRPRIKDTMSESDLFDAFRDMVKNLDDGHVSLSARIDDETKRARTGGAGTISRMREAFKPTAELKTFGDYFRNWRTQLYDGIREKTLKGKSKTIANDKIIWGRVHESIGYMSISGMGGYSFGTTDSQVAALHEALNEVLTDLADTDALIIDVSFNGGGSDLFSIEIASHFTNKRRLGFSKWPQERKQYRQDRYVVPYTEQNKSGAMYVKPVYVVTNDITASAAEIFTMCMRSLPQVTTVGIPTEGALSDILGKDLPNGWELGLSNEIYVDHKGVCHEGPGIPPDVRMDIFDPKDISNVGHTESMRRLVKMILKKRSQ